MSQTTRSLAAVRAFRVQQPSRGFHSPFAVLRAAGTPLTSSPTSSSTTSPIDDAPPTYEKQADSTSEPHITSSGAKTYVVSEPDPSNKAYEIPYGAYSTTAPYANMTSKDTPKNPERNQGTKTLSHPHSGGGRADPQN